MSIDTIPPYPTFSEPSSFEHKKWLQLLGDEVRKFYSEGTWTPSLDQLAPGSITATYTTRAGRWWKVGNLVTVAGVVQTSSYAYSLVAPLVVVDLPFAPDTTAAGNLNFFAGSVQVNTFTVPNWVPVSCRLSYPSVSASGKPGLGLIRQTTDGSARINWVFTNELTATPNFTFQITYPTFP